MTQPLSLHHVTVMEVSPAELVAIAAELGYQHVCLFTHVAPEAQQFFPCNWDSATRKEVRLLCAETGISAHSLEYFDVFPNIDLDIYRKGLEIGAELGARCATTHVDDSDLSWAIDNFGQFCDLAAEFDISPAIEFTSLAGSATLGAATRIIEGANRRNGGIALDTLHLFRSGAGVDDVAKLDPQLIKSMQMSDGPMALENSDDYAHETMFERQIPGAGQFPLAELCKFIPPGLVIDLEVPLQSLRDRGISAVERARLVAEGARQLIGNAKVRHPADG